MARPAPNVVWLALRSVGVVADVGTTYNSSQTYQHLVAHNPDVRSGPLLTLLSPYVYLQDNSQRHKVGEERRRGLDMACSRAQ